MDDLSKNFPSYTKGTAHWFNKLTDKLDIAIQHAKRLEEHNSEAKSNNPSTDMHKLVEHLEALRLRS